MEPTVYANNIADLNAMTDTLCIESQRLRDLAARTNLTKLRDSLVCAADKIGAAALLVTLHRDEIAEIL